MHAQGEYTEADCLQDIEGTEASGELAKFL